MTSLASIRTKANAHYTCRECGSTELIQAHHEIPGEDDSQIPLCAECHSGKHPNVPKALFFYKTSQPYWHNKSADSLARELGVHSRTIIRAARRLKIPSGKLRSLDKILIKNNVRTRRVPMLKEKVIPIRETYYYFCAKCSLTWVSLIDSKHCPLRHKSVAKAIIGC